MKVLVPVEDSLFAALIADFICKHQWPPKTEFIVSHVIDPDLLNHPAELSFLHLVESCRQQAMDSGTALVRSVAETIIEAVPDAIVAQQVVHDFVREHIVRTAEEWGADMVIAGSHGRSGFNKFLLGSVSLALASSLSAPLILVKPSPAVLADWAKMQNEDLMETTLYNTQIAGLRSAAEEFRVMLAMDSSLVSKDMVDFVAQHKWSPNSQFKLVSAVDLPHHLFASPPTDDELLEQIICDREGILNVLAAQLRTQLHTTCTSTQVEFGKPKDVIVRAIDQWQATLLVLGSHARPAFQRFFLGGTSLPIMCAVPCAVMLVKEKSRARSHKSAPSELLVNRP